VLKSATDRRGYVLENKFAKFSEITQCNGHYAVQGHSMSPILVLIESSCTTSYEWLILTYLLSYTVFSYGWLLVKFLLARGECLTLTLSLGGFPTNIAISDISLKTRFFGLQFRCRKCWCTASITFTYMWSAPESYRIRWNYAADRAITPFKVIQGDWICTNRKLICDFLLKINTNLAPVLHRFRDIAFDKSKIDIFG